MAFLKIYRHLRQYGFSASIKKVFSVMPRYILHIYLWRVRKCRCCSRLTIFLADSAAAESRACLFCSANERYELLAAEIKARFIANLAGKDILELDPHSPLKGILSRARTHKRTFYESGTARGSVRHDGAVCEDITCLTCEDESLDLIISSDVLEHVPSLQNAFSETARVLRPGGAHLFTVPPRSATKKRAEVVDGDVVHFMTPEYHGDPLSPEGILAFWDIGPDLPQQFSTSCLNIRILSDMVSSTGRVVWIAERTCPSAPTG